MIPYLHNAIFKVNNFLESLPSFWIMRSQRSRRRDKGLWPRVYNLCMNNAGRLSQCSFLHFLPRQRTVITPTTENRTLLLSSTYTRARETSSSSLGSRCVQWLGEGLSMPSPNCPVLCCPQPYRVAPVFVQVVSPPLGWPPLSSFFLS